MLILGTRDNARDTDLSDILPEDIEEKVKELADVSMGTEIADDDIMNIQYLCDQVHTDFISIPLTSDYPFSWAQAFWLLLPVMWCIVLMATATNV